MLDFTRVFHTGVRVHDVDAAMAELGPTLGITWASVQHMPARSVWTPERGLEHVALTFTYSCEGPQHVELLRGAPGSVWDCGESPGLHHVGVWSDDVAGDVERLPRPGGRSPPPRPLARRRVRLVRLRPIAVRLAASSSSPRPRSRASTRGGRAVRWGANAINRTPHAACRRGRRPAHWRRRGYLAVTDCPNAGTHAGSPASRCSWGARSAPPASARRPTARTPGPRSDRPDRRRSCRRGTRLVGAGRALERHRRRHGAVARLLRGEPDRAGNDDQCHVSVHGRCAPCLSARSRSGTLRRWMDR